MKGSYQQGIRLAAKLLMIIVVVTCNCQWSIAQNSYDQSKVSAAIQHWTQKLKNFDKSKTTLLFTTSTMGCTDCCASAINNTIAEANKAHIEANILVVVGTPLPKEGLAIRKKFKTANVSEDAADVLDSVFQANPATPDMYVIDPAGRVLYYHPDLPHNYIDGPSIQEHVSTDGTSKKGAASIRSLVPLQEDDDNIIGEVRSVYMNRQKRTLEFLEPRLNSLYKFNVDDGKLIAVYAVDSSINWHFKRPDDREDFWTSLATFYNPLVRYEAVMHHPDTDTDYVLSELFTHYTLTVDSNRRSDADTGSKLDTTVGWQKGPCILTVINGRVASVSKVEQSPWFVYGEPAFLGKDIIMPCLWEGALDENMPPQHLKDSLYSFLIVEHEAYKVKPVVRTANLEALSGRPFNRRYTGMVCSTTNEFFYINRGNRVFLKGWKSGDSVLYSFLHMSGLLTQDSGVGVMDIATNSSSVNMLVLSKRTQDSLTQLYIQNYDMAGTFKKETAIRTDDDPILSAHIAGYDENDMYILMKQRNARWRLAKIPVQ